MRPVQRTADRGQLQLDKNAFSLGTCFDLFPKTFKQHRRFRFDPHSARCDNRDLFCKTEPFHAAQHRIRKPQCLFLYDLPCHSVARVGRLEKYLHQGNDWKPFFPFRNGIHEFFRRFAAQKFQDRLCHCSGRAAAHQRIINRADGAFCKAGASSIEIACRTSDAAHLQHRPALVDPADHRACAVDGANPIS